MIPLTLAVLLLISAVVPAIAGDVFVNGYFRKDGTYVQPYVRSAPDSSVNNNWSTYPNVNPYTGQQGTQQPKIFDGYNGFGTTNNPGLGATPQPRIRSGW